MEWMKRFFKQPEHPAKRCAYAVTTGDYVGEIFVFIDTTDENYKFLSIPKNINRIVPKEKFEFGLEANIIEYVERLPRQVYKIITAQFYYNENPNNRWKQFDSPDVLDGKESIEKS